MGSLFRTGALLAALVALSVAGAPAQPGVTPADEGLIRSLSSARWFTFGAPDGAVTLEAGRMRVRALTGFDAGGHVGAILRVPIERPASGQRYVYVWGYRCTSVLRPGRGYLLLAPGEEELSRIDETAYFGVMIDASPSRMLMARMILRGEEFGYHNLSPVDDTDFRFVLTPTGQQLELKPSSSSAWIRFPAPENPWADTASEPLRLRLESYGDPRGALSSDYRIAGVQVSDRDLSAPDLPTAPSLMEVDMAAITAPVERDLQSGAAPLTVELETITTPTLVTAEPPPAHRWESTIAGFEAQDRETPPPDDAILFVGSSSFVGWKTLARDFAPLPVLNRAFGGSTTEEVLHFVDRIVIPYAPRVIVYYAGDNDLATPEGDPETAFVGFRNFVAQVQSALPDTRIVYVSIKPSPRRWTSWPNAQTANARVQALCESDPRLAFVDISPTLLDENGEPRPDQFVDDQLHIRPEVYAEWTALIRPVVEQALEATASESEDAGPTVTEL